MILELFVFSKDSMAASALPSRPARHRQRPSGIWECAGLRFPIPRHTEINEWTARTIIVKLTKHLENLAEEEAP